jgi:dTMP kinase
LHLPTFPSSRLLFQRGNFGEERYEKIDFQKKVREQFLALKAEDTASGAIDWHVLNADQSIADLHKDIVAVVDGVMKGLGSKPASKLWLK